MYMARLTNRTMAGVRVLIAHYSGGSPLTLLNEVIAQLDRVDVLEHLAPF
jgi:hypothetical protein